MPEVQPAFDAHHPPDRAGIDKCVHCGFCLPTCPTYLLWNEEMDTPRGRLYLMKAGLDGRVPMNDTFVKHFDACLGCMACVTACPSGVPYAPLIEATRGLHPVDIWTAILVGHATRCLLSVMRFRQGKWRDIRVEIEPART